MTFEKNEDKRRFHRIFYTAEALLVGEGSRHGCKIIDLSLRGCLLDFGEPWSGSLEMPYTLLLKLSDDESIAMDLGVVHVAGTQIGFKCLHIDIDSISSLRRLVELNLGDSELLERELAALSDFDSWRSAKSQSE